MVKKLLERIKNGDQRAMSQLYQRYVERLSSVCYRYVPADDDAKDVLQNSFVSIFTSIGSFEFRDEASFEGWMVRIVVNEALHFLRDCRRLLLVELTERTAGQTADEEEPVADGLSADDLHRLVSELPDGYRTVVNLYVFEGYSHQKIADLLGIKASTSASQLHYAKLLLAKKIKEFNKAKV